MDTDELQTLLENKLAAKDVVPMRPPIEEAEPDTGDDLAQQA
jgi:hypothetical protein